MVAVAWQHADLEKTIEDCDARLKEERKIVQSNLWSRDREDELKTAIKEAEATSEGVSGIPDSAVNKDGYELQLDSVKKKFQAATASLIHWEIWIPEAQKASLDGRAKVVQA